MNNNSNAAEPAAAKKAKAAKKLLKNPTDLAVAWRLSVIMASLQQQKQPQRIVVSHNCETTLANDLNLNFDQLFPFPFLTISIFLCSKRLRPYSLSY